MKKLAVLGSTGSIGLSTLDIVRQHPDRFQVVSLSCHSQYEKLMEQMTEFRPQVVSVGNEDIYKKLKAAWQDSSIEILFGESGAISVATHTDVDLVVSAIVGASGLMPTLKAIEAKKTIGLANKESMVIAGEIMSQLAIENDVEILPIDSEHSAIFQCLNGEHKDDIEKIILTASGGPFFKTPFSEFSKITLEQALKHPNWSMGAKITIDSATMMNKGLEVMEAFHLFQMPIEKIDVVVHPQSIIHSMVEFVDGAVIAQMGEPDMREPIAYALSYPRRIKTNIKKLDLPERENLNFYKPDFKKFPCLKMAFDVAKSGGSFAPVLNAANEIAVEAFLKKKVSFLEIPQIIDETLQNHNRKNLESLEDVIKADQWARNFATNTMQKLAVA